MARRSGPIPTTTTPHIRPTCAFTSAVAERRPDLLPRSPERLRHVTALQTGIKRTCPGGLPGRYDAAYQEPDARYVAAERHCACQASARLRYADRADVQPGGSSSGTDCRVAPTRTPQAIRGAH